MWHVCVVKVVIRSADPGVVAEVRDASLWRGDDTPWGLLMQKRSHLWELNRGVAREYLGTGEDGVDAEGRQSRSGVVDPDVGDDASSIGSLTVRAHELVCKKVVRLGHLGYVASVRRLSLSLRHGSPNVAR